eukprot:Gregarina_sp_Pseudo_9__577@NODE_1370_length_1658_cov_28_806053_g1279_i0_p1_GENE_NODE_1370_length_1658_cov_28_806053_g1279_i0NODE_1370_length_1658_cov_28_806053_g1279_i0_p1_ORF_typecomplete_len412_score45_77IIGP/PF05049_13/6_8e33FeoB_N/PF02421_18/1_3e05RsgA_GTPase/PF03193_16/0_00021RsgA_GTPase/PF03193_16/1_3e02MMR_HSR1/PF01926_23/0_00012ABC_tran/PF00005_27/5_3e03ABC_tran/PF00005_27/0_0013MeaB/PF03308_16/0_00059MeaB/PF03308_16/5_1e03AIG1/PF04548_16/0_0017Dynamin_N/PF00350_23/2_7e03Dynamin_N/PF0035
MNRAEVADYLFGVIKRLLGGPVDCRYLASTESEICDHFETLRNALGAADSGHPDTNVMGCRTDEWHSDTASGEEQLRKIQQEVISLQQQEAAATQQLAEVQAQAGRHAPVSSRPNAATMRAKRQDLQRLAVSVSPHATKFAYIAVVGAGGAGKSSLINSVRGLRKKDQGAAPVNSVQSPGSEAKPKCSMPYLVSNIPVILFEVPGFGGMDCVRWNFWEEHDLCAFDALILVWDSRLTDTDVSIISNCLSMSVRIIVVRNKTDVDLSSLMEEVNNDAEIQELKKEYKHSSQHLLKKSLDGVSGSTRDGYESFLLNERSLRSLIKGRRGTDRVAMDEEKFLEALKRFAHEFSSNAGSPPSNSKPPVAGGAKSPTTAHHRSVSVTDAQFNASSGNSQPPHVPSRSSLPVNRYKH